MTTKPTPARIDDTIRFYDLLARIEEHVGGRRTLNACDGRMDWPQRGVYFFFEAGEQRSLPGSGDRVVRVGTSRTLWKRLSQHRGSVKSAGGNHRISIFRRLVGPALAKRGDCPLPASWNITGKEARKLGMTRAAVKDEAGLERCVSAHIGRMPFLWLNVPDNPSPHSSREYIERNAIALLSHARAVGADTPSDRWLGAYSDRPLVRASGLWNNHYVEDDYDAAFLDRMEALVEAWA